MALTTLEGMTQDIWDSLSPIDRVRLLDGSDLVPQLRGHEGKKVRVRLDDGTTQCFWVGRTCGWRPVHLVLPSRNSRDSGDLAPRNIISVDVLDVG